MKIKFPWETQEDLILYEDVKWNSNTKDHVAYLSRDNLLEIVEGVWYISHPNKWDGITNFWCGPPDKRKPHYPITWLASLIHDIGCRYWNTDKNFPYSRFKVDWLFFKLLRDLDSKIFKYFLSYIYYAAVTLFTIYRYAERIIK